MIRAAAILSLALMCGGCVAAAPAAVMLVTMAAVPGARDELRAGGALAEGAADMGEAPAAEPALDDAGGDPAAIPGLMRLGPLPPQTLPAGSCALFLFSRAETPDFIFYAPSDDSEGLIRVNGEPVRIRRFEETPEGDALMTQSYVGAGGLEARLRLTLGEALADGRRAPEAAIRLTRPGSDTLVVPAVGLVACEPA